MPCPETVLLNKDLVFSVAVHDPDTGNLYDSTPSYKIYKDEDNSLVTSGTMNKIDSSETGFYSKTLNCDDQTFEDGKSYTLCIKATIGSATGGNIFQFSTHQEIVATIGWPITIQGFDQMNGHLVRIVGRYL